MLVPVLTWVALLRLSSPDTVVDAEVPASSWHLSYAAALGSELDSNARREPEGDQVVQDGLLRGTWTGDAAWRGAGQRLDLSLSSGAKVFARERDENTVVGLLTLSYRLGLEGGWRVGLDLVGRGRSLVDGQRDYLAGATEAVVGTDALGAVDLELRLGPRAFYYRPEPVFSSTGLGAALWARLALTRREQLALNVDLDARAFPWSRALLSFGDQGVGSFADNPRLDLRPTASLRVVSSRALYTQASYTLAYNASNSLGETYLRHQLQGVVGAHLPLDLFATVTLGVQLARYPGGLALSQRLLLEDSDESQNKLVLTLQYPLGRWLAVEGRLGLYSNELGAAGLRFARVTSYLGFRYRS
ncbi:MAG: hypothetical protein ABIJ09_20800 [Pseudomonadota bacterium]